MKKLNWNTVLLLGIFPSFGWAGKELYTEVRLTHDAIIMIRSQMTPRSDFDVQMSEVRTRLSAVEVEIQKLKEKR